MFIKKSARQIYKHSEKHYVSRTSWLRAAVLGANDGIISISSLMVGIAAASTSKEDIIFSGIAGMVAGAMSMAAGEYVSVSSQSDLENADLEREKKELSDTPEEELNELIDIYIDHGLNKTLAKQVAIALTRKEALKTHAREELGITHFTKAKPFEAALASAFAFTVGSIPPVLSAFLLDHAFFIQYASIVSILLLGILGAFSAKISGSPILKPTLRIVIWGAVAMGLSAFIGRLIGGSV